MNDLVVNEVVEICLVQRNGVTGVSKKLKGYQQLPYDPDPRDIADWYFEE
jgi:hypothetical protein